MEGATTCSGLCRSVVDRHGALMQQIADWLEKLGMPEYAQRFAENDIDFSILPELTNQDLEKIGVASLGHRRKILRAIAAFASAPATVVPPALSASSSAPKPTPAVGASPPTSTPLAAAEAAGERRYLTVILCDLVGSTAISAQLDAEGGATSSAPISTPLPLRSPKWVAISRRSLVTD